MRSCVPCSCLEHDTLVDFPFGDHQGVSFPA